ncbi:MAG: hypothetical protein LBR10_03370, partial [Prevotellaceae bacterium]|nr:hypothetical protein [Prevotellaceae bacterium]
MKRTFKFYVLFVAILCCLSVKTDLFAQTSPVLSDDYVHVLNVPVNIDVLANDNPGACADRNSLTLDTIAGTGLRYGSLTLNPDKTVTYSAFKNAQGVDRISYSVRCNADIDTAMLYVVVANPLSADYTACYGATIYVEMPTIADVAYFWYDAASGGSMLLNTGSNRIGIVKSNSPVESLYVEARYRGTAGSSRREIKVSLSDNCGSVNPVGCPKDGKLLFREDFGGNSPQDADRGTIPLPAGVTSYQFKAAGGIGQNEYAIVKTGGLEQNPNAWHQGFSDHTYPGDNKRGYMFMVDAATTADKFYEHTITGLCSDINQLYFSTWVANLVLQGASQDQDPIL